MVRCRDATASSFASKFRYEVFAHFHSVAVVFGIDCLACLDELIVNNQFFVKENYEHGLDFALRLPRFFLSRRVWAFPLVAHVWSPSYFPENCTKFDAHPLFLC
jgi:hypothetical protein